VLRSNFAEIENLEQEMSALEIFGRELFLEINNLRMEKVRPLGFFLFLMTYVTFPMDIQERMRFSRTLQGRLYNLLGYFLAGYCLYKLLMVRTVILSMSVPISDSLFGPETSTTGDS